MKLECEHCYNTFVIRPEDRDVKIHFCPHCGEPTHDEDDDNNELGFKYYEN